MPEYTLQFSELAISRQTLNAELGYGDIVPQPDVSEMIGRVWQNAEEVCRPRATFEIIHGETTDRTHLRIGGVEFRCGSVITGYLKGVERLVVFVSTAGTEYEAYLNELKASGNLVAEYIADALGSVIAEALVTEIGQKVEKEIMETGESMTYPYSPGYCGWHLREQAKLFSLLPKEPCGVRLTESSLMVPIKSVSGIYGLGMGIEKKGYACDICGLATCYKRNQKKAY